jgi:LysM repeat protein
MRWRALLIVSACVNVVLLAFWLHDRKPAPASAPESEDAPAPARTQVIVRKQFFTWDQLESSDYATYIANLRDVNCPEQTIRDIIIADVSALYGKKRAEEIQRAEAASWRATPTAAELAASDKRLYDIEAERKATLTRLLGPNWEAKDPSFAQRRRAGISLDGPVLGQLPESVKRSLINIVSTSQQRMEELQALAAAEGRKPTSTEIAAIREQSRTEMAKILSPSQLEEFLLRYSQTATDLRADLASLKYFKTTATEFRALFRACDPIDVKLAALDELDPKTTDLRRSLLDQRSSAIKLALGSKRFELFQELHDPNFREAYAQAATAGDPTAVGAIQEINQLTQQELARLKGGSNLTPEQLAIAAKRLELEQAKATAEALGQTVPPDPNAPPPPSATEAKPQNRVYVIKSGDTFGAISTAYGIPVNAILNANPGMQINGLKPGQRINIPPQPKPISQ